MPAPFGGVGTANSTTVKSKVDTAQRDRGTTTATDELRPRLMLRVHAMPERTAGSADATEPYIDDISLQWSEPVDEGSMP